MSLIENETETINFINRVIKPLEDDEVYLTLLCARKKYCTLISSSEEILNREIIRSNDINKILRKFKKSGTVEDIYTDNSSNNIPKDAMALYMLLDPRSTLKAYGEFNKSINEWMLSDLRNSNHVLERDLSLYRRIDLKLFSAIHKSRSRSIYFIVDIDKKDGELLNFVISFEPIKPYITWISETRGGYHVILERNDTTGKYIRDLQTKHIEYIEILKEPMTPIPGALQGGFLVKEVKI